mmetsp:Transcript_19561/g.67124  ORF Transcript_19561/g.67124 Transcript_19561/m.67124 type:complete len:207 (+) Transcript_19561:461-1081(+)
MYWRFSSRPWPRNSTSPTSASSSSSSGRLPFSTLRREDVRRRDEPAAIRIILIIPSRFPLVEAEVVRDARVPREPGAPRHLRGLERRLSRERGAEEGRQGVVVELAKDVGGVEAVRGLRRAEVCPQPLSPPARMRRRIVCNVLEIVVEDDVREKLDVVVAGGVVLDDLGGKLPRLVIVPRRRSVREVRGPDDGNVGGRGVGVAERV